MFLFYLKKTVLVLHVLEKTVKQKIFEICNISH